jgi:hypothetical protein
MRSIVRLDDAPQSRDRILRRHRPRLCSASRRKRGALHCVRGTILPANQLLCYRIAPAPAAGAGVIRLGAARHFCERDALRRAELCRYFDLADCWLREYPRRVCADRRARQRDIGKPLILERQLRALDLLVRARTLQALRKMTPVGLHERAFAVMRAGRGDMRALCSRSAMMRA